MTDSRDPSGLGEHMLTLAAALRCRAGLIAPPHAQYLVARARAGGGEAAAIDAAGDPGAAAAWLREGGWALAHVHAGIGWEGNGLERVARAGGVAAVIRTEHLPYLLTDPAHRAAHMAALAGVDRLILVSEGVRASYRAAGVRGRMRVVRNGIAPAAAGPGRAAARAALGLAADAPVALSVGRIEAQKDHATLIAAWRRVVDWSPGAVLLVAGQGGLEFAAREAADALGLEGAVRFLGVRGDVPALMAAADVFALASRFEGLPLVVLEAMAAGLAVVATRVCGTDEAVEDGVTGRLVAAGDADAMGVALVDVLGDAAARAAMGAAGAARFAAEFTAARMGAETMAVYREVWAAARRAVAA